MTHSAYSVTAPARASLSTGPLAEGVVAVLRAMAGLMLVQHGAQKLLGWFGGAGGAGGTVELLSRMGLAGTLELVGGVLLAVGLFTRPVAVLLSGLMAAAYFTAHFPQSFFPVMNGGELAALYSFVFLGFAALGGGRYSVDALLARRNAAAAR